MESEFAGDFADPDQLIEDAAGQEPIRIRIQPMIRDKDGQYQGWRVSWTLECDSTAKAFATRDAMMAFFTAVAKEGPEKVAAALRTAIQREKQPVTTHLEAGSFLL